MEVQGFGKNVVRMETKVMDIQGFGKKARRIKTTFQKVVSKKKKNEGKFLGYLKTFTFASRAIHYGIIFFNRYLNFSFQKCLLNK